MIKSIKFVSVYVSDQDAALAFYTQKLGFTVVTDQPMGPDARWIELKIPGAETGLVIAKPFQPENVVGAFMNMAFVADDVQKTYEELSARGVVRTCRTGPRSRCPTIPPTPAARCSCCSPPG